VQIISMKPEVPVHFWISSPYVLLWLAFVDDDEHGVRTHFDSIKIVHGEYLLNVCLTRSRSLSVIELACRLFLIACVFKMRE
jgi:hypothetical protein